MIRGRVLTSNEKPLAGVRITATPRSTLRSDARPDDPDARRGLGYALSSVGDALYLIGDKDAALDHYQRSLPIRKKLMADWAQGQGK